MEKTCTQCQAMYQVTEEDDAFRKKVSPVFGGKKFVIPPPTLCPDCRQQRRIAFRNERSLYHRTCDLTGKKIISFYSPASVHTSADRPDKDYIVYDREAWWSDTWEPLGYGRSFDFSQTFFPQFHALWKAVPHPSLTIKKSENCDFNNYMSNCKDCYLSFTTFFSENIYYSNWLIWGKDCIDCTHSVYDELCYNCLDTNKCYNSSFLQNCKNVTNSHFLFDCSHCDSCFLCTGLRHKKYYFQNKACSKDEYEQKMKQLFPLSFSNMKKCKERLAHLKMQQPHKHLQIEKSEKCSGDFILNSKNCYYCFDVIDGENFTYCYDIGLGHDCYDATMCGFDIKHNYEIHSGEGQQNVLFCNRCWIGDNLMYCDDCHSCSSCFGCVGLRHKKYCVFNKQYSQKEYEELVPKIIQHMISTREWGEFFPISHSPFCYNESLAQEHYPITKEEALNMGLSWKEKEAFTSLHQKRAIPESISGVTEDICKETLCCEECKGAYRIIAHELNFYRRKGFPLPHHCPHCRYLERMKDRPPRKLWSRTCMKCEKEVKTNFSPARNEKVYCEDCYLQEMYVGDIEKRVISSS